MQKKDLLSWMRERNVSNAQFAAKANLNEKEFETILKKKGPLNKGMIEDFKIVKKLFEAKKVEAPVKPAETSEKKAVCAKEGCKSAEKECNKEPRQMTFADLFPKLPLPCGVLHVHREPEEEPVTKKQALQMFLMSLHALVEAFVEEQE